MVAATYRMLMNGTLCQDLGANYHFNDRDKGKHIVRLVNCLQNLRFDAQITHLSA